jgi:tetratricopeptide (TPR) repeat protein
MADRYTYVPFIGLFVMIAWGVTQLTARWRFRQLVLSVSAGLVLTALMICTRMQAGYWQNSVSLFEHAVNVTDDNYLAHVSLGIALCEQGRVDEAIAHYNQSMQIKSNYPIAHNSLGAALLRKGRIQEAIPHFSRALEIDPKAEGALENLRIALRQIGTTTDEAVSHNLKAIALAGEGKLDEAIVELSKALRLKPKFAEAHYNMGNALAGQDKLDEAIDHFSEAIRIKPDYPEAHNNLGILLARKGKLDDAVDHFSEALRIRPDFAEAQNNLRRASQQTRKP